jgi:hypothetical protein
MGELGGLFPASELSVGLGGIDLDKLDGRLLRLTLASLGAEDDTVIRASYVLDQRKLAID